VGLKVKHRQLARQVVVFIEHPLTNSMASFNFTSAVLDEGTTFIFGLWVCITDGAGSFRWYFVNNMKLEASATAQHGDLDETLVPDYPGRSRRGPLPTQLRLVLHQDFSGRIQSDLRSSVQNSYSSYTIRLLSTRSSLNPSSSSHWRRTWIIYSSSKMRESPRVGRSPQCHV
jgi:hypothetical protein